MFLSGRSRARARAKSISSNRRPLSRYLAIAHLAITMTPCMCREIRPTTSEYRRAIEIAFGARVQDRNDRDDGKSSPTEDLSRGLLISLVPISYLACTEQCYPTAKSSCRKMQFSMIPYSKARLSIETHSSLDKVDCWSKVWILFPTFLLFGIKRNASSFGTPSSRKFFQDTSKSTPRTLVVSSPTTPSHSRSFLAERAATRKSGQS